MSENFHLKCSKCKRSTDEVYTRDRFGNIQVNNDALHDFIKFMIEHSENHTNNTNFRFVDHLTAYGNSIEQHRNVLIKDDKTDDE